MSSMTFCGISRRSSRWGIACSRRPRPPAHAGNRQTQSRSGTAFRRSTGCCPGMGLRACKPGTAPAYPSRCDGAHVVEEPCRNLDSIAPDHLGQQRRRASPGRPRRSRCRPSPGPSLLRIARGPLLAFRPEGRRVHAAERLGQRHQRHRAPLRRAALKRQIHVIAGPRSSMMKNPCSRLPV